MPSDSGKSRMDGAGRTSEPRRNRKKRDMGRKDWSRQKGDKRSLTEEHTAKRRRLKDNGEDLPIYATEFSKEDIDAEGRRPKRKVAVMIGYCGSGYKGMQMAPDQKTIEGDLFQAFVKAGAISKANATDPKKSSFVRCARTDKGVHAAGNVISLKLIVEDEDIVQKINENLSPQIRVWGYELTSKGFSAYQLCDSRIYEYLIPTYSFLPPHPNSFLGQKIVEFAIQNNDLDRVKERQAEVEGFWEAVDDEVIRPILDGYDEETRAILVKALYPREIATQAENDAGGNPQQPEPSRDHLEDAGGLSFDSSVQDQSREDTTVELTKKDPRRDPVIADAIKTLRNAYIAAKRAYRISPERLRRVIDTFALYHGHQRYHNYTIGKQFRDDSAARYIRTFNVNPTPIIINATEWLSLKVHGQSFMMHQIRKMVGMAALIVRCGCDPIRIKESFGPERLSIPKAPGLGLLLERPVFDSYNKRAKHDLGREEISFDKYEKEMLEFKQREVYERIYREEEELHTFGQFFNHVDNFSSEAFLFVTSGGIKATENPLTEPVMSHGNAHGAALVAAGLDSEGEDQAISSEHGGDLEGG